MENFNEFSPIEQAAMEQSPIHETDVHHNFMGGGSKFIEDTGAVHVENINTKEITVAATNTDGPGLDVTDTAPEIVVATPVKVAAAAGGLVVGGVFTKKQVNLFKSINKECSIDELIDLRISLINAKKRKK